MKQSRWAGTSQYLAIQAVPLLVLTILAHWQGWIPTEALFYLLALVGFLGAQTYGESTFTSKDQRGPARDGFFLFPMLYCY